MRYILVVIVSLIASSVYAQSERDINVSLDVGWTGFTSEESVNDLLDTLGRAGLSNWRTQENTFAPHVGVNLHLGSNWVVGVGYQAERKKVLEIFRDNTPHIDSITGSAVWFSAHVERKFTITQRLSSFVSVGATQSVVKGWARVSGVTASTRIDEVDPMFRVGIAAHNKNLQTRTSVTKRVADDDEDLVYALSFRLSLAN